jgi:hypothetical protein
MSSDGLTWQRTGPEPDPAVVARNEELREQELADQQRLYDEANEERATRRAEQS